MFVALAGCHRSAPPAVIDPAIASCIPAGTTLIAGVDLDRLRTSPLYRNLSSATASLLEPLRGASYLVVAANGPSLTVIARGNFTEPPAGAVLIAPGLALLGSPDAVDAARARHRARTVAVPQLLTDAEPVAANPVWAIALGGATLPVSGNLANLNNFIHAAQSTRLAGRLGDRLSIDITSVCLTADDALQLERTLRAFASLAGMRRGTPFEIRLERNGREVHTAMSVDAAAAENFLR